LNTRPIMGSCISLEPWIAALSNSRVKFLVASWRIRALVCISLGGMTPNCQSSNLDIAPHNCGWVFLNSRSGIHHTTFARVITTQRSIKLYWGLPAIRNPGFCYQNARTSTLQSDESSESTKSDSCDRRRVATRAFDTSVFVFFVCDRAALVQVAVRCEVLS
jgi:hypothetical protein